MEVSRSLTNEKGFSFIELMVAIAVFSIGILAVAHIQTYAMGGNKNAFEQTEATAWASNIVETLVSLPYNDPQLDPASSPMSVTSGMYNEYNVTWTVTDNGNGTKTLQITVAWQEKGNNKNLIFDYVKSQAI